MTKQHRLSTINHLMDALKPQSNVPLYSNTAIGTWPLMGELLHLVQREGDWAAIGRTIKLNCAQTVRTCKPRPKVIRDLNPDFRINPDSYPCVCRMAPKIL